MRLDKAAYLEVDVRDKNVMHDLGACIARILQVITSDYI